MKISLIAKGVNEEVQDMIDASKKLGVELELESNLTFNSLKDKIKTLGDVVIFRASDLSRTDKVSCCQLLKLQKKILINNAYGSQPMLPYKSYQQTVVKSIKGINYIPTYKCSNKQDLLQIIDDGKIKFPFICKPDWGKMGIGVEIVRDSGDLEELSKTLNFDQMIFQNFIANKCDYRIIVVGGKPLGVLKRIAKPGSHLNNISQGGRGEKEQDENMLNHLYSISSKITHIFELGLAGVDIIQDEKTNELFFMEVNTAPQWGGDQGFKSIVGVNVAEEIIKYCKKKHELSKAIEPKAIADIIFEQMSDRPESLAHNHFHFLTRAYLWLKSPKEERALASLRVHYLEKLKDNARYTAGNNELKTKLYQQNSRDFYYNKYPQLKKYNGILFKVLFSDSVYQFNTRDLVSTQISDSEFIDFYKKVYTDVDAIKYLSTHAINYFYLLRNYFGIDKFQQYGLDLDVSYFIKIARENYSDTQLEKKLKVYLLTHCIIGESKFYQDKVADPKYTEMLDILDTYITDNYFDISLDNKFEFLVCCRICNYPVSKTLEKQIYDEARLSIANDGVYIHDKHNSAEKSKKDYVSSEHRNVLFIMSAKEFII